MAWKAKTPKTWTWHQDTCRASELAATCATIAASKQLIKFVVGPFSDNSLVIVSCQGTPLPKKEKAIVE